MARSRKNNPQQTPPPNRPAAPPTKKPKTADGAAATESTVSSPSSSGGPLKLQYIEAGTLKANPRNWRTHPPEQMAALAATMKETGWAGALLFNKTTGRLIDGHARLQHAMNSATGGKTILPVLVGEWTEAQELKILATHDPLAAMATVDADQLDALLDDVDLTGPGLEDLNEQLNDALADFDAEPEEGDDDEADADSGGGSSGGSKKSKDIPETYQLVITCRDEADQQKLYNRLNRRGYQVKVLTL